MSISVISFGQRINTYKKGENRVEEIFNDDDLLSRTVEYDRFGRDIDAKTFDAKGNVTEHMMKTYSQDGCIETFKSNFQEYTRKTCTKIENSLKHRIEEYVSKTSPDKNYVHDFIYDLKGKLIKIVTNGKVTDLRK